MDKDRAWIYCRARGGADCAEALETQKRRLEVYAQEHGLEVIGASSDTGSAVGARHPGLLKLRREVEKGRVDVLLMKNLSLAGRDLEELLRILTMLRRNGVRLCTAAEGEIYLDMGALFSDLLTKEGRGGGKAWPARAEGD